MIDHFFISLFQKFPKLQSFFKVSMLQSHKVAKFKNSVPCTFKKNFHSILGLKRKLLRSLILTDCSLTTAARLVRAGIICIGLSKIYPSGIRYYVTIYYLIYLCITIYYLIYFLRKQHPPVTGLELLFDG